MDKNALPINHSQSVELILRESRAHDYAPLFSWFSSERDFIQWAGPSLGIIKTPKALQSEIEKGNYQSYSLVDVQTQSLLGFGQIQLWDTRAHLGRLVISPHHRGQRLSYKLVNALIDEAAKQKAIKTLSLFVYEHNQVALKSYQNLGFVPTAYPKGIEKIKGCQFMTMAY